MCTCLTNKNCYI